MPNFLGVERFRMFGQRGVDNHSAVACAVMPDCSFSGGAATVAWLIAGVRGVLADVDAAPAACPVAMVPGSADHADPVRRTSRRVASANAFSAAFAIEYVDRNATGKLASIDPTITTVPCRRLRSPNATAW